MPKNILQDIVPPEKRSIRNIPVPQRKRIDQKPSIDAIRPIEKPVQQYDEPLIQIHDNEHHKDVQEIYPFTTSQGTSRFGSKKIIWLSVACAAVLIGIAVTSLFSGATVTITPATASSAITPEVALSATKGVQETGLGFEIVTLNKSLSTVVSATGEERVERKASGTIVIFNEFDTNSQRLIKNTRFQTPEGLIYRINESVVVPGMKTQGGNSVPGQIEVLVYADEIGEKYNIGKKDFVIPGFKGDPRFDKIYARSKTDMAGGFVGMVKKVSDADKNTARQKLQAELTLITKKEVMGQIPNSFVMFDSAYRIQFSELPQSNSGEQEVNINEQATITAIIFDKQKFAQHVARTLQLEIAEHDVNVQNFADVTFTLGDASKFTEDTETITFTLDGMLKFISNIKTDQIALDLVGKEKSEIKTMFADQASIENAQVSVRPFWKRTLPDNPEEIKITVNEPEI